MSQYNVVEHLLFPSTSLNRKKLRAALQSKTIVITGASSGIGQRLAYLLSDLDVHLILVARREHRLLTMKYEIENSTARVSIHAADLRKTDELEDFLFFLHQLPHGVDVLINNAGHSIRRTIKDSLERHHDFTRTMAINYDAPVRLLLSVIPILQQHRGHIINISTINTSLIPLPYWAAYQASKAAFDTWFRSAAPELNAMDISTTSIYLPLVRTPMILPTADYQDKPAMSTDHAAHIIAKSMYTRRNRIQPWWLIYAQLASILFRGVWDRAMPVKLRKRGDNVGMH